MKKATKKSKKTESKTKTRKTVKKSLKFGTKAEADAKIKPETKAIIDAKVEVGATLKSQRPAPKSELKIVGASSGRILNSDGGSNSNVVWEIDDRFGTAKAERILTPEGNPTEFAMVYGKDADDAWQPVRPVSDRYTPIKTGMIVDAILERVDLDVGKENVTINRFGTHQRIDIAMKGADVVMGSNGAFDVGTLFTENGTGKKDIITPMIQVVNSYAATSGVHIKVGWFRVVCSNGLVIQLEGSTNLVSHNIHTIYEVDRLVNELGSFECQYKQSEKVLMNLTKKKLTPKDLEKLKDRLPKNYHESFVEHVEMGGRSAWAAINGLTYIQSHELSIARGKIVQPLIDSLIKAVA